MTKYLELEAYERTELFIYETRVPTDVGRYAMQLASHFALVAAQPDGEDSAGRAKLGLMHPQDVAARACDVAAAVWAELARRGWLLDLPDVRRLPHRRVSTLPPPDTNLPDNSTT